MRGCTPIRAVEILKDHAISDPVQVYRDREVRQKL